MPESGSGKTMQGKCLYEYAVIRFLPRVERGEFMNVGIILYCHSLKFLQTAFDIDEKRISSFCGNFAIHEIKEHLRAFEEICTGGPDSGPIGSLSLKERFRWLTAPRSTVLQISPIHTGLCNDPGEMLRHLLEKLVK